MDVKLKGENRVRQFRQVAEKLVARISAYEGVAGIVCLGGVVRGFADKFSDLDITVFLSKRDEQLRMRICKTGADVGKRVNVDLDLEVHFLDDFKRHGRSEIERWDFSKAEIVYDPKGKIRELFQNKLRVPKDFWIKRIAICGEYVKWYCCPPRAEVGSIAEAWIERGDLASAHYCLTYSVDLLLEIIFALNKEFLPVQKWRVFYSYSLKWLPKDYVKLLKEAMIIKELSAHDLKRRLKALRKMWLGIVPKIEEETGLTVDLMTKYYMEKVLHQTAQPKP
jgi:predicted nucleotidyltransferase